MVLFQSQTRADGYCGYQRSLIAFILISTPTSSSAESRETFAAAGNVLKKYEKSSYRFVAFDICVGRTGKSCSIVTELKEENRQ